VEGDVVFSLCLVGFVFDVFVMGEVLFVDVDFDWLSNCECEVMCFIVCGYVYKEVVKELFILVKIVEIYVLVVLCKF